MTTYIKNLLLITFLLPAFSFCSQPKESTTRIVCKYACSGAVLGGATFFKISGIHPVNSNHNAFIVSLGMLFGGSIGTLVAMEKIFTDKK